jgi:hypothetical protein
MPRQVLDAPPQVREQRDPRLRGIEAGRAKVAQQRRVRIGLGELEAPEQLRQPIQLRRLEPQHLPHLARGAAIAVGDDVGRHRRAVAAVLLVDVLDDAFAPIAARQIQIDIRPLAALFREEALEQQVHPHRVHRRDAQAVADGAVGRRAASLRQDLLLAAEVDDVPDDQEVAGEIELLDQIEFAGDLRAGLVVKRPVALARAHQRDGAQKRAGRFARRHREIRKAIADIGHRVLDPIGQRARGGQRRGLVAEQRRHLGRRLQIPLRVGRQLPPRLFDRRLVADAGEHVIERPLDRIGKAHAV